MANAAEDVDDAAVNLDGTRGAVFAVESGTVIRIGWQNSEYHSGDHAGAGYRVTIQTDQTHQRMYGHLDLDSVDVTYNQKITDGQYIGSYANPTNGHSNGPHVHDQLTEYDSARNRYYPIDPGSVSPIMDGRVTTPFGQFDSMHKLIGHQGVDWVNF